MDTACLQTRASLPSRTWAAGHQRGPRQSSASQKGKLRIGLHRITHRRVTDTERVPRSRCCGPSAWPKPPHHPAAAPQARERQRDSGCRRSRTSEPKNSAQKSRAILRLTLISLKTQANVREDTGIACHGHARRVSPRSRGRRGRPRSAAKSSAMNASIGRALQPNRRFPSRSHSKAMAAVLLLETLPVFLSNI